MVKSNLALLFDVESFWQVLCIKAAKLWASVSNLPFF